MRTFLGPLRQHAEVTGSAIIGHGDPVPRFAALYPAERVLRIPAETTFTPPAESDWDAIEIAGTLKFPRDRDTVLRTIHLTVLPGGTLDLGTEADPVLAKAEIVFRDVPLRKGTIEEPDIDPFQFGNGLIVFGQWLSHGRPIERTWSTTDELAAGATQVRVPADWLPGDELLIPDTRQPLWGQLRAVPKVMGQKIPIRRESPVWLAEDRTLSKPLDFEHSAARAPDGTVRYMPYVANAGRNIVYRSENPQGTRGHTILLEMAHWDVRYSAFVGLGRTLPVPLHSTTQSNGAVVQIGTNQVGRYPLHVHHVSGHADEQGVTGRFIGNFIDGSDVSKWGLVIHSSSDCLVRDNVINRCVGAGLVTEDGDEVRNVLDRNFVMGCIGQQGQNDPLDAKFSILKGIPGGEGSAGWMHGSGNTVTNNVFCNSISGLNFVHIGQPAGRKIPGTPGGPKDTPFNSHASTPISTAGNVMFGNARFGLETWSLHLVWPPTWIGSDMDVWNNGEQNVMFGAAEVTSLELRNLRVLGQGGTIRGLPIAPGYVHHFVFRDSRVEGCSVGVQNAQHNLLLDNLDLQNVANVDLRNGEKPNQSFSVTRIRCTPLPGFPPQPCVLANFPLEQPEEPPPPPPPPPLTLEQRVERLERAVFGGQR